MVKTKTVNICTCDICGNENAQPYRIIAYRTFDANDGRVLYDPPVIEERNMDLCQECAAKSTNLHDTGICCEEYKLEPYKKSNVITTKFEYMLDKIRKRKISWYIGRTDGKEDEIVLLEDIEKIFRL